MFLTGYRELFADEYGRMTENVDREQMKNFILSRFQNHNLNNGIILDAGCGTGDLCLLLCKHGYDMIGVDESGEMLDNAMIAAKEAGADILYICQSLAELDLYGTVDGAVSTLDTLNHIIDEEELQQALDRISLFMVPGGIFIFDVNTEYKHREVLGSNCFIYDYEDLYCGWQNEYDPVDEITDIKLDIFLQNTDGSYDRTEIEFSERYYSHEKLGEMLAKAGFQILEIKDDYTENELGAMSQRAVYVVQKEQ